MMGFTYFTMKSVIVVVAILLINGIQAGGKKGHRVRDMVLMKVQETRPVCAEKLGLLEDDIKEFEARYRSKELLESDPDTYGGYVGCLLNDWNIFEENGEVNHGTFAAIIEKFKKEEEKQKITYFENQLSRILEGTTSLADSGSRCIIAKMHEKKEKSEEP